MQQQLKLIWVMRNKDKISNQHFPPENFLRTSQGPSSIGSLPQAIGQYLLHHNLIRGLQGNLCSGTWRTYSPSFLSDPNGYLIFLTSSSFLSPNSYSMLFLLFEMMEDLHDGAQLYPARSLSSNGQPLASSYRAKTFLCKQHTTIFVCSQ